MAFNADRFAVSSRCFVVGRCLLFLGALSIAGPTLAAVGRTAGHFSVGAGAATYSIPIFTPPGPRGVQPSVAISYNSNGGIGYMGRGWSLAGFSAISRCNKTVAQDGNATPIALGSGDGYCLDGNRLRLQSGTYGQGGSVWATEIADFSRITASGTQTGAGSSPVGPESWVVERKDGTTWTYGATTDSRVAAGTYSIARVWRLSQIQDRAGNKVVFTYEAQDSTTVGTTHPTKIEWTQTSHASGTYVYSMEFEYTSAGNPVISSQAGRLAGASILDTDLLTGISVKQSGTTVRKYVLGYGTSPTTGAKRLITVTECSDAATTDCLAATTIGYQDGQAGLESSPSFSTSISSSATNFSGKLDFNGDGLNDLTYYRNGAWYARLSSLSGYSSEYAIGSAELSLTYGDPYGGGSDAVLGRVSGTWHVFRWNGSSFSAVSTGVTGQDDVRLMDVDGDGRDDLLYMDYYSATLVTVPSTSSGTTLSFGSPQSSPSCPYWFCVAEAGLLGPHYDRFDVNGDGRDDVIAYYSFGGCPSSCSATQNAMVAGDNYQFSPVANVWNTPYPAIGPQNLNGDQCQDLYVDYVPMMSMCQGVVPTSAPAGGYAGQADWNGDQRDDALVSISGSLHVQIANGQNLQSAQSVTLPSGCAGWFMDANGDGLADYVCRNGTTLYTYLHNSSTVIPDLATSFTDGFGVTQSVSYAISTHAGYAPYSTASYPQRDVVEPRVLARTTTESDGVGGTFTKTYSYFGATEDVRRREPQGFEKIEVVDSRNSTVQVRKFKREFPYSGMAVEEALYQPGGVTLISSKAATGTYDTLDTTAFNERYFPHMSSMIEDAYEVGGARDGDWITRVEVSNTFDSWGNVTASTTTTTDKDAYSGLNGHSWTQAMSASITPDTSSNWCLAQPSSSSVIYSATTGEPTVVRSKSFTPDYANCRMSADSVEPSSSTRRVDTSYGYDSFGNVNSVSVTGRNPNGTNMTTRTATVSWGTTGQFAVSETNALSQTTTRTFHSTFGSLVTETDPNGIVVANNEYDTFGRITRSIRADGTATRTTYADCATYGCENGDPSSGATGINKMIVIASERNTSDVQFRDSWTYLDQFERPIVQKRMTMAGTYSRSGTQYDWLGRVHRQTAPCDASSCTAYWVTNTYDLLGRVSTQTRPESQSSSTPVTATFTYAGRSQTVTDPRSKNSTKILDVNGRMRQSIDHDGYYQVFGYDAFGSLKQVTDALSNTLFTAGYSYGIRAFQDSTNDMDLGSWAYDYNSLGEQVGWADAKSQSFSQTFDALSRLTSRTEAEGTTSWTWGTSAGSHNIGRLAGVSMTGYSESLAYDSIGRPSTQTITTDQAYAIDYAYTDQGLLDTLTYPTSTSSVRVKVKYGYAYGILQSATDWTSGSAGTVYWTANAQNVRGQTTQETLGNGVVTNRSFDAVTGWLNSIQSGLSGGMGLQNQSYLYDVIGNVTQRQENTLGLTENSCYDDLYRLVKTELGTTPSPTCASPDLVVTYDAMGNITNRTDVNSNATWSYHSTKKHAVASTGSGGTSYGYDANGNMTSRGGSTITWASYNLPTGLSTGSESTTFYYGPDRQYYRQEYSGPSGIESTYYVGGILEKVYDGTTTDWRHYIKAEGQTVAIVSREAPGSNAVYYPLDDNQGSGSHLTNSSGTGIARQSYTAFGLPRDGNDWDGAVPSGDKTAINGISRRGYTSHSMLGDMGLIHMNGRVQDAITGRFLSPDPFVQSPGFTQSYNRYAYVNNNPLSYTDPSGFVCEDTQGNIISQEDCQELADVEILGTRLSNSEYFAFLLELSRNCRSDFYYSVECDSSYQWQVFQDAQHMARQRAEARAEALAATGSRSSQTRATSTTAPPQSEEELAARANSGLTAGAAVAEATAGRASISGNLNVYRAFNGNQYAATVRVSTLARGIGAATFVGGFGMDLMMLQTGQISGAKALANTSVGAYGVLGGVAAAPAVVPYFALEAFYPGGFPAAMEDYAAIDSYMMQFDPGWKKR